ncbi:MAG: AAA family ATPase, partial [Chloroflexi bacterium]|nr:AAA family ATPase [Chloroflexota bacterium]
MAAKAVSPFVGRVDELRRLSKAIDLAAEGQGSVIFLTGQPGIGKTRLAREALSLAKARGFTTLEGHAHSLESELSYAPLVEAFEPLLRSPSVEAHGLDPTSLKALVSDLPSLGRLFEGLSLPPPPFPLETLSDPGLEKTRLFEAMSRLLERLTRSAPVALFVDDLQWADPATLELLYYLVRGLADQRLLLIASYSTDALDSARGLRALVGSLRRDGLAEEILIPPLGREAVDEMVRAILGGEAPSDLLALLDARAGGTPLFIEALIDALIDSAHLACSVHGWVLDSRGAADLPPSVRHLIVERLERLEPTDRRVVELIAVIGDATTHSILRAASGLGEEDLIQSLRRLMAAGLVAEGMEGLDSAYSITHPLVQEVAYDELPGAARRRSHVAAIGALESFHAKDDANRLARHYRGAGAEADPARALEVLLEAGERAWAIYANEEAARHYVAALAVLRGGEGSGVGGQG